jgi:hypothetical protein
MENQNISWKVRDDMKLKFDEKAETKRFYVDFLRVAGSDLRDLEKSVGNLSDWLQGACENRPYKEVTVIRKILAVESKLRQIFVKVFDLRETVNQLREQIEKHGLE